MTSRNIFREKAVTLTKFFVYYCKVKIKIKKITKINEYQFVYFKTYLKVSVQVVGSSKSCFTGLIRTLKI